jgi:shingomyelin synthase
MFSVVQPLLPPSTKGNAWTSSSTGNILSPPIEYYDEDEKTDGLAIHRGGVPNGVVKIDVPAPLREEPRFPKEKWKTFIGLCHVLLSYKLTSTEVIVSHGFFPLNISCYESQHQEGFFFPPLQKIIRTRT